MSLEERFQLAVEFIRSLPPKGDFQPSNEQKLTFYSLYKQGSLGRCSGAQPSLWKPVERAKWFVLRLVLVKGSVDTV
jgi:acyl-CoA-binding protein